MKQVQHSTFKAVGRAYWRFFLPAWLWPAVALLAASVARALGIGDWYSYIVLALFFASFFLSIAPGLVYSAPYWPVAFWALVAPFAAWVCGSVLLAGVWALFA